MKRDMKKCLGIGVAALGLFLAAGIPALAKNARTVNLQHDVVMQGTSLPAGKYSVEWQTHSPEASVQFLQHHKVVLATEGRVEQRKQAYDRDAVVYDLAPDGSMSIAEIRFADSNKVLVFPQ